MKFKIGEFSKLCQVTVKTLRHYELIGLLTPLEVDEWTGYRYYDIGQLRRIARIAYLKRLGFSLEEITELLEQGGNYLDSELIKFKSLPEVPAALCINHCGAYDKMPETFTDLYAYAEANGYEPTDKARFCYIDGIWNKDSIDEWLTEIQLPVKS